MSSCRLQEQKARAASPMGPWYWPQGLGIVLSPACACHGYGKWTRQSSRVFKRDLQTLPPDQATEESYQSVACIALLTSQPSSLHSSLEILGSFWLLLLPFPWCMNEHLCIFSSCSHSLKGSTVFLWLLFLRYVLLLGSSGSGWQIWSEISL